jgi:hypothetical protein
MNDGGYVVAGVTSSFGAGAEDVYVVRTDADGEVLWTTAHGGPGDDNGWSVHETGTGLAVAGFTDSFGAEGYNCYLMALDAAGTMQWSNTYGGPGVDRCWSMLPLEDRGYILVGETTSSGGGEEDCYLIRTDAAGDELWSRVFGGENGDRCFSIALAHDGGFLLAGQTFSQGSGDRDAYVIKTDAAGNEEWSKTFGGMESDVAHSVTATADGDFLVTGYTTSFAGNGDDPYLIKLDAAGRVLWTRVLEMPGLHHTITGEQAVDGGFCLGGFSEHESDATNAALLVKTDGAGEIEWTRYLLRTSDARAFGYTVRATADGGCVIAGHTSVESAGDLDLLLVKVDSSGL